MSSTRTATDGKARQSRHMSAPEFVENRGLKGRCVAERVSLLKSAEERSLILFLLARSVKDGGLDQVVRESLELFSVRIGTPTMRKLKQLKPGQTCNAEQVRAIRAEIPGGENMFRLKGEVDERELYLLPDPDSNSHYGEAYRRQVDYDCRLREIEEEAKHQPTSYPMDVFLEACKAAAVGLPDFLTELCLNPAIEPGKAELWWFDDVWSGLLEYQKRHAQRVAGDFAQTSISKEVFATLDFIVTMGGIGMIEGQTRLGKSTATEAWCQMHLGEARYVSIDNDKSESGFLRQLCKPCGLACGEDLNPDRMRNAIKEFFINTKLLLVIDEAHNLFTDSKQTKAIPHRVDWLRTALGAFGVPIVLLCTPQFTERRIQVERQSKYSMSQLSGRVDRYTRLPDVTTPADLMIVARKLLPEGDERCLKKIVGYALTNGTDMPGVSKFVKEARYAAMQAGRESVTFADLEVALEKVIQSDKAQKSPASGPRDPRSSVTRRTNGYPSADESAPSHNATETLEPPRKHGSSEPGLVGNGGRVPSFT